MPLSAFQPSNYNRLLKEKADLIRKDFVDFNIPVLSIYSSPPEHFRMRAEFRVWHEGDETFFVMFRSQAPKTPHKITSFPIGSEAINTILQKLPEELKKHEILKKRLFQIEILSTLSGEILLTLIYHTRLNEQWTQQAKQLAQTLAVDLIGRSKKQKIIISKDYITEKLQVFDKTYQYQQLEGSFTQPNALVNQKMLEWAQQQTASLDGDLLELYCGNGNFTIALALNFDRILATEVSKTSVRSALANLTINAINNVRIVRMSSEEFTQALNAEREFRRLKDIDLDAYNFSTILVDPPRAGLDQATVELVSRFENIIYISCNPQTLKDNLLTIGKSHEIEAFALFDQFPYTHHIECGVRLKRRQEPVGFDRS